MSNLRLFQLKNSTNKPNVDFSEWINIEFVDPFDNHRHGIRGVQIKQIMNEGLTMSSSRNLPCFCGSGKKQKFCHSDINPNSVVANYYKIVNRLNEEIKNNCQYFVCKRGCSDCCTNDFDVSINEFFTILNYLQIKCNDEQIEKICNKAKLNIASVTKDKNKVIISRCMFINERDDSCEIYEVRPIVCRKYGYYLPTQCDIINDNERAQQSLIEGSRIDAGENFRYFRSNNKIIQPVQKPLAYWFSKLENGKLSTSKMNKLYYASRNLPVSEYVQILKF